MRGPWIRALLQKGPQPAGSASGAQPQLGGWLHERRLLALLLLAFGALYAAHLHSHAMLYWDETEYATLGRSILRGEGFAISGKPNELRPPLLPLAAATGLALGGERRAALLAPITLFALLAIATVFSAARRRYGAPAGAAAAVLLGFFPEFWRSTEFFLSEIPYLFFFFGATALFYRGLYEEPRAFHASWLCWGLAVSTRYTAVLFGPIALLFVAIALASRDPVARRSLRSLDFWASPLLGFALLAPWLWRQHALFGDALVGFRGASMQLQLYMPDASMPLYFYPQQLPAMLSWTGCAALVLGLAWALRSRDRFALHCALAAVFILGWFSAYRFKEVRMATSALPFLALLAALGVTQTQLPARFAARRNVLLALALAGHAVLSGVQVLGRPAWPGWLTLLDAAQFLRAHTPADARILAANVPHFSWYADRYTEDFPAEEDLPAALEQVHWVVINDYEPGQRPYVFGLLRRLDWSDVRSQRVQVFRDPGSLTVVLPAPLLRERLLDDD